MGSLRSLVNGAGSDAGSDAGIAMWRSLVNGAGSDAGISVRI